MMGEAVPFKDDLTSFGDLNFLSTPERKRLEGMRFPKRRSDWLSGRRTAKELLRTCEPNLKALPAEAITIANRPGGAPEVQVDGKVIPGHLTISHSRDHTLAAWTCAQVTGIGADIEFIEPRAEVFVEDYFTTTENKYLQQFTNVKYDQLVTLIWSAKEAALKALGIGLGMDTRQVEVLVSNAVVAYEWESFSINTEMMKKKTWRGFWRRFGEFIITIAVCGVEGEVKLVQTHPVTRDPA